MLERNPNRRRTEHFVIPLIQEEYNRVRDELYWVAAITIAEIKLSHKKQTKTTASVIAMKPSSTDEQEKKHEI